MADKRPLGSRFPISHERLLSLRQRPMRVTDLFSRAVLDRIFSSAFSARLRPKILQRVRSTDFPRYQMIDHVSASIRAEVFNVDSMFQESRYMPNVAAAIERCTNVGYVPYCNSTRGQTRSWHGLRAARQWHR